MAIKKSEVYYEKTVGNKHCFKHQLPGQPIIIVADIDKKEAWSRFLEEYERCKTSIEESVLPISDVSNSVCEHRYTSADSTEDFNLDEYTRQVIETVEKYDGNDRFVLVANLIAEAHRKGKRYGHNKAVELCQNALKGMEMANSSSY